MRNAAVLIVGNEILSGDIQDENGPFLIERFVEHGIRVVRMLTVPDERETITAELSRLRAVADAVVVSGGLGPTHDDQTRPAIADALGAVLEPNSDAESRIRGFYGERVTDAELAMALFPRGARLVSGAGTGTFGFEAGGVYALPGVPFLFRDLIDGIVTDFEADPLFRREFRTTLREGEIAPRLADAQGRAGMHLKRSMRD